MDGPRSLDSGRNDAYRAGTTSLRRRHGAEQPLEPRDLPTLVSIEEVSAISEVMSSTSSAPPEGGSWQ
jgi:hypothetical protein